MSTLDAENGPLFHAERGWCGALRVAGNVAHVFARERRFWWIVEACRRGLMPPAEGARHLVPLRQRSVWVVERYIEDAARQLDVRDWPDDLDMEGKQRMIRFELANFGMNVLSVGAPNPYGRKYAPRENAPMLTALELLERVLARRCLKCGGKVIVVGRQRQRPGVRRRHYYCAPCAEGVVGNELEADWKRLRRLLAQAESVIASSGRR